MRSVRAILCAVALSVCFACAGFDQESFKQAKKQAEKGDPEAEMDLGLMYHLGEGVAQNYSEALIWYRRASDHGSGHDLVAFPEHDRGFDDGLWMNQIQNEETRFLKPCVVTLPIGMAADGTDGIHRERRLLPQASEILVRIAGNEWHAQNGLARVLRIENPDDLEARHLSQDIDAHLGVAPAAEEHDARAFRRLCSV
jgi:hypothetical protein